MPSINYNEIEFLINKSPLKNKNFKFFIETGTHFGNTVRNVIPFFEEIHTIELSEKFHSRAKGIFEKDKNVTLYLGDSSVVLPTILNKLNENSIFFLDGHFSSEDTAQGNKDVPLIEELKSIHDSFLFESIIIIDDHRLFGTKVNEDWLEITEENILKSLGERVISYEIKDDRFIVYITSKN